MATNLKIIIDAVNRATAPLRKVTKDVRQFRNLVKLQAKDSGFTDFLSRTTRAAGNLGRQMRRLSGFSAVGGGILGYTFKKQFVDTPILFERYQIQLETLEGSSEKAKKAMEWIDAFAVNAPPQIEGVVESFAKLRTFGLDPMNGTMQAIVDQSEKLGGGQERLNGIVLALGQAWTKQKLQGEEALQLIERGVPVWDLLSKATGRSAVELQELSSKGKLTRKSISLLIDEMGKNAEGAAKKQMKTFGGMLSNLQDHWGRFTRMVMDAGVFDHMKNKLQGFLERLDMIAESGHLQIIADEFAGKLIVFFKEAWKAGRQLISVIDKLANTIGGYKNLMIGVGLIITGPLLAAVASFTAAITSLAVTIIPLIGGAFGAALIAAAPLIAAVTALGAAIALIYTRWEKMADGLKQLKENFSFISERDPSAPAVDRRGRVKTLDQLKTKTEVGGEIHVKIDSEGRPKIGRMSKRNKNVDIVATAGTMMTTP